MSLSLPRGEKKMCTVPFFRADNDDERETPLSYSYCLTCRGKPIPLTNPPPSPRAVTPLPHPGKEVAGAGGMVGRNGRDFFKKKRFFQVISSHVTAPLL